MQLFHDPDEHAAYPHKFIVNETRTVKHGRTFITVNEFVICAMCDHWADRPLTGLCTCPVSCHAEARSVDEIPEINLADSALHLVQWS
jgi:hypothetical protein